MMKITKTCPASGVADCPSRANATSVRLTALSMISMPIRIITALRFESAIHSPIPNKTAPTIRKCWIEIRSYVARKGANAVTLSLPAHECRWNRRRLLLFVHATTAHQHDRGDRRRQQQHRRDLERQRVQIQQQVADAVHRRRKDVVVRRP